jgi:Rho-binding antiterminator
MKPEYKPIACGSYDELEALSMHKENCAIEYKTEEGKNETVNGTITNIQTDHHEEYLEMDNGKKIRLDKIVTVNGTNFKR